MVDSHEGSSSWATGRWCRGTGRSAVYLYDDSGQLITIGVTDGATAEVGATADLLGLGWIPE